MTDILETYMTISQAADFLGHNRATIRRWIEEGRLSATAVGREKLIPRQEAEHLKSHLDIDDFFSFAAWMDLGMIGSPGSIKFVSSGYVMGAHPTESSHAFVVNGDGFRKVVRVRFEEIEDITNNW